MLFQRIIYILPLVLTLGRMAYGTPVNPEPEMESSQSQESQIKNPKDKKEQTLIRDLKITPIKGDTKKPVTIARKPKRFYTFHHSISPRIGTWNSTENNTNFYFVGVNYLLPTGPKRYWEFGIDWLSNNRGWLHASRRWIFKSDATFRPFLKGGLTLNLNPSETLRTFLKEDYYYASLVGGFEYWLVDRTSFRLDLAARANHQGTLIASLAIGYSWGW